MNFIESIKMAFASLAINKMRSFLTMLGIIIGISSVITITTIGNSISKTLSNTFSEIGETTLTVYLTIKDDYSGSDWSMDKDDMLDLEMVQGLIAQHPNELTYSCNEGFGMASVINENGKPVNVNMLGVSDDYFDPPAFKRQIVRGRGVSKGDMEGSRHTCLISEFFASQYFNDPDSAIGKTINFEMMDGTNMRLTVVGVMEYTELENNFYGINKVRNEQEKLEIATAVFFPYNTMLSVQGLTQKETKIDTVSIGWTVDCDKDTAKQYIQDYFSPIYEDNEKWGIEIYDQSEELGMINTVLNVITIAISVIAAISLIVGGVGVMNIMLVSILERTREIGVRKALGALNSDIRSQFVIEAIIICLTGGTIGVLLGIFNGILLSKIGSMVLQNMASEYAEYIVLTVQPSLSAIIISLSFSVLIGLVFGYYPAKRAGNMNPIDALRYD